MAAILLAGCGGSSKNDDPTPTTSEGSSTVAADADVTSGCWTEDQRVASEGDPSVAQQWSAPPAMAIDPEKTYTAEIKTNYGTITVEFYPEDAPQTVNNFICLAKAGYYDNTPFHRIISGFVIQGGDPTGTGRGGPGYKFNDEPISKDYLKGTLAMANAGPNTNGSQFFIVLDNLTGRLPKNYTVFGQVTSGLDVVDQIAAVPVVRSDSGENSKPSQSVMLESVTVTES
jgi:cyclophilin family peptidyl-prolyl cis-trans isomerase